MKKRNRLGRLLAGALCTLMMLGTLPLSPLSFAAEGTTPTAPEELSALESSRVSSSTVQDIYKNPVYVHCYADGETTYTASAIGKSGSVVVLYVMNTNTERIGKNTDESIVRSMLVRGYYVVVLDYRDNDVTSPDLDYSIQDIRGKICDGEILTEGKPADASRSVALNYVVPAGYDIAYNVPFFSYDKHGSAGTLERIVEIWNNDFRSVKRDTVVRWTDGDGNRKTTKTVADGYDVWYTDATGKNPRAGSDLSSLSAEEAGKYCYTKIGNTWAESVFDCVKPDGTFIDLSLYADIIYPTGVADSLATVVLFSSSETRVNGWTSATRPQLTGFLFSGYIGVVADYGYVPMARNDHYGYFSGNDREYCVSGDNYTYSLGVYNGVKAETSLLRMLRTVGRDGVMLGDGRELSIPVDGERIGVYGNSKAGVCARLGNKNPELLEEIRHFDGHNGETRLEALENPDIYGYSDPFVSGDASTDVRIAYPEEQPYLQYRDGGTISSRANLVYAQCGGCFESITEGNSPIFSTGTQLAGGNGCSYEAFYRNTLNQARAGNVPFYGLISPNVGHDFGYGEDKYYGIDTYYAFHRYANYWLQNGAPSCDIIDVDSANDLGIDMTRDIDYIYEIGDGSAIRLQFIGAVGGEEIGKVEIVDAKTGEGVKGQWTSSFGGVQWKFVPYDLKENTYYRITVPTTLRAKNGRCIEEEKSLLFRTARGEGADALTETKDGVTYFTFEEADTADSYRTELRFTVTDDGARNTLVAKVARLAEGETYADVTMWESVGEVAVVGAGMYALDVTDAVKSLGGRLVFSLSQKHAAGTSENTFDFNENTDLSSLSFGRINWLTVASIDAPTEDEEKMLRVDGFTRCSSWIDLENQLNGNHITNPSLFLRIDTGISEKKLTAADYGRTFRISFRVYDTTSRLLTFRMMYESGNGAYDFNSPRQTYRTKANDWTEIEYTFTFDNLDALTLYDGRYLYLSAENKGVIHIDEKTAVSPNEMTDAKKTKPSNYVGKTGLTSDYKTYYDALAAMKDGAVTVKDAQPFYIDAVTFTEIKTTVTPVSGRLVTHPKSEKTLTSTGAVSLDSNHPDATGTGTLSVAGGVQGTDKISKKTYVKLSLAEYTVGDVAYFSFKTSGATNTISVWGIADATAEGWEPSTVTAATAPANDPYSSGVLSSAVWNGSPILTKSVRDGDTVTVDLTDYARERKAAGAATLTLILTAASTDDAAVTRMDFEDANAAKLLDSTYRYKYGYDKNTSDGIRTGSEWGKENSYYYISTAHVNDAPHFNGLFSDVTPTSNTDHKLWSEDDIGRTFRITFRAKTDGNANNKIHYIHFGMMSAMNRNAYSARKAGAKTVADETYAGDQYGWYMYQKSEDVAVNSEWQTYTYTFTVDETMLPRQMVQWSESGDALVAKELSLEAISYFGVTGVCDDYSGGENILFIDDLQCEEIGGETLIAPMAKATPTQDRVLDFHTVSDWWLYCQQNGYANKNATGSEGYHSLLSGVVRSDGTTGKVFSFASGKAGATPNLTGIFSGTDAQTATTVHKLWEAADIGRTFRISFMVQVPEGSNVTSLQYGLKSRVSRGVGGTFNLAADETRSADTVGYSFNFYQSETVNFSDADKGKWKECTLTFTVTEQMLPRHIIRSNGNDEGRQAISYLGVRPVTTGTYSIDTSKIYIDKITTEELPHTGETLGMMDFDLAAYNNAAACRNYISNGGFNWDKDNVQTVEKTGGVTALKLRPFATYNTLRVTGIFDTNGTQTGYNTHRLWTADDVGKTFRISFRAMADREGSLSFGMMRGYRATDMATSAAGNSQYYTEENPDPVDYSFNFYGTAGTGTFAEADRWYTFTYEFTVTEEMLPKTIKRRDGGTWGTGPCAISYFGIQPTGFTYTGVDTNDSTRGQNLAGRPTVYLDDITVREVTDFAGTTLDMSGSLAVSGAGNSDALGILATPKAERENVRYTLLPFVTSKNNALTDAHLTFTLSGADGERMTLYLLHGDFSSLTFAEIRRRLTAEVLTFTAREGENRIDVTEAVRDSLGGTLTFVLTVEGESDPIGVTSPTLTVGTEKSDFDASNFKVKSNITLSSDFLYHTYIPVISALTALTLNGEGVDLATLPTKVIEGTLCYIVTKPVAPKDGADAFTLRVTLLTNGETKSATYTLSIPKYTAKITGDTAYDETTRTLMCDILSYISASMTYFGTSTVEKQQAIKDIIGENYHADLTAESVGLTGEKKDSSDTGSALSSVCLNLDATSSFVFYLKEGKESLAHSFKFISAKGAPLTVEVNREAIGARRTYLEVKTYAYAMGDTLTFTYTDEAGDPQRGSYNLAAYYLGIDPEEADITVDLRANREALQTLAIRLAKYAKSATAYRDSVIRTTASGEEN